MRHGARSGRASSCACSTTRGACLAGAVIDDRVRDGVAVMATGAWYARRREGLELAGNPNVLSLDVGTSRLTQGCAALSVLVEVERYAGKAALPSRRPRVAPSVPDPAAPAPPRKIHVKRQVTTRKRRAPRARQRAARRGKLRGSSATIHCRTPDAAARPLLYRPERSALCASPRSLPPLPDRDSVWHRYREIRADTERLAAPLATEDYVVQSMPDTSPAKWHLAHVSWFFENFVVAPYAPRLRAVPPAVRLPLQLVLRNGRHVLPAPAARAALAADGRRGLPVSRARRPRASPPCWTPSATSAGARSRDASNSACITSSSTRSCCSPM